MRNRDGAELMLNHPEGYVVSVGADDAATHGQLHRRLVIQQDGPGNRQLHVQTGWQRTASVEYDTGARKVQGVTPTATEQLATADQLPTDLHLDRIPPALSPVTGNSFILTQLCS